MSDPVRIIAGALKAIKAEDEPHRTIMLSAVRAELDAIQGGCPCEQLANQSKQPTSVVTRIFRAPHESTVRITAGCDACTLTGNGATVEMAIRDMHDE